MMDDSDSSGDSETELDSSIMVRDPVSSNDTPYMPGQPKSLAGMAMWAFGLGISFASSLIALILVRLWAPGSPHWRLAFYGTTLSIFHFLEFWATARYNTKDAGVRSFVPTSNLQVYILAHKFAFLECLVYRIYYWHGIKPFPGPPILINIGFPLVIAGQLARTLAIIHAGPAISQNKQNRKQGGQVIVTTGIYSILRHPSYFGFFWWSLGTQLVLGNTFSFLGFAIVLWNFFAGRIKREEESLYRSSGKSYLDYKNRVRTMMPFIG